jgi:hypothetical protein
LEGAVVGATGVNVKEVLVVVRLNADGSGAGRECDTVLRACVAFDLVVR